jgi:uncharacterized protein (DUF58 family)
MLVSGIFGRKNIHEIDVILEFPDEIFAGMDIPMVARLINKRRFMPAFLIKVSIGGHEVLFPFVRARSQDTRHMSLRFETRGVHFVDHLIVSSVFPFNFFTRFKRITRDISLIVFPKPLRCTLVDAFARQTAYKGDTSSNQAGFDSDIMAIRDYVSGDPPKYIDWKATARTGLLKTKVHSSEQLPRVIIDFDKMDKTNLEYTISCVTFVILRLTRSNSPVELVIEGESHGPGTSTPNKIEMLKKLALYGQH